MKDTLKCILFCCLIFFSACSQAAIESYVGHDYSGVQAYIANANHNVSNLNYGLPHDQGVSGAPVPDTVFQVGDTITIGFELTVGVIVASDFYFNNDADACYRPPTATDILNINFTGTQTASEAGFFANCLDYNGIGDPTKDYSYSGKDPEYELLDWQYYLVSDNNVTISGFEPQNVDSDPSVGFSYNNFNSSGALTFKINSGIDDQFDSLGHWDAYIIIENTVFKLDNGFDVIPEPSSIYLLGMSFLLLRYRVRK